MTVVIKAVRFINSLSFMLFTLSITVRIIFPTILQVYQRQSCETWISATRSVCTSDGHRDRQTLQSDVAAFYRCPCSLFFARFTESSRSSEWIGKIRGNKNSPLTSKKIVRIYIRWRTDIFDIRPVEMGIVQRANEKRRRTNERTN